jgi:ATP-dependent DNA helicase DinG
MAEAVHATVSNGGNLMVEAGTGTGKTLAYLVPALLAGRRVIVSTGTRNLQDQIHHQELPFLRNKIGMSFKACVMKGRDNYLCRYRLAEFEREPLLEDLSEQSWLPQISEWSRTTLSGDRAELDGLPDKLKLWRDVNARSDTCLGSSCPEFDECWLTKLKRRAEDADVVVVNHHLFFADLAVRTAYGAVLPDYDTVIFDEAHLLEEIATQYFGVQVFSGQFEELARTAEKMAAAAGGPTAAGGGAAMLRQAAQAFFDVIKTRLQGVIGRLRFDPPERGGLDIDVEWAFLCEALDDLLRLCEETGAMEGGPSSLPQRVEELRDALTFILGRNDSSHVYGIEQRGRRSQVLSAVPIDVSALLREAVFEKLHAAVLTSATLTVSGEFTFFKQRLGLETADDLVVESPFDYEHQALLFLPRRMPEPRDRQFIERAIEEIVRLLEISDGRAFLLFTSYANLERVHDGLLDIDRWPLIVQGEGSKIALVERFKTTRGAVLLGTTSFWHGVDVPGAALSMVVVDKLPFAVPGDPLIAARIDRIREAGGNPFAEYQTPMAVLELKQGLGRLIRSRTDRGILAVLDPRLMTKRYGRIFLESLPPFRVIRDLAEGNEFFGELPV